MKPFFQHLKGDSVAIAGLSLLLGCTVFFCIPINEVLDFPTFKFLFTYASFIGYFITMLVDNKRKTGKIFRFYSLPHNLFLLLIGNLSAYALNLSIPIFQQSVTWLSIFLVLLNVALVFIALRQKFEPDGWNHVVVAILSAGALFQLYQTIFAAPIMLYGAIFCWFFGLPLHAFVPLWFLLAQGFLLRRFLQTSKSYWKSAAIGLALPLMVLIGFIVRWNAVGSHLAQVHHLSLAPLENEGLPEWVIVGQRIEEDWMTKRILNSEVRLSFVALASRASFQTEDGDRHDPMIVAASLFAKSGGLSQSQQSQLQSALFDSRHKTEPRLWSGESLRTNDIITNVQLFPEYRMAYTEKTLTIENTGEWQNDRQEAIYSFYLPEGAVVTSASLWMGEREEKAVLTTRSKADTAYQTIVGVQRRDPMLVRWQEGNRVSVRVFPCTPAEKRKFKIGFTTSLRFEKSSLIYENIDFDGCKKEGAKETVQVLTEGEAADFSADLNFINKGGYRQFSGNYQPGWTLRMAAPPLGEQAFSFNGRSFQLKPLPEILEPFFYKEIYLDINDGWSKRQFNTVWKSIREKEVYAWSGSMVRLTEDNKDAVFRELKQLNYSVFPFQKIGRPADALVITSACGFSPVAGDLTGSGFAKEMQAFFSKTEKPVRVLNLGQEISPYIKGLDELRTLQVCTAELDKATQWLEKQQFPAFQETLETIVLEQSAMKIRVSPAQPLANQTSSAAAPPDHLLRLFAYNSLMKDLGKNYFNLDQAEATLIGQAQEAYVVTPVSSLISLETEQDYERFDIQKPGENSLKNASLKSSGAVPEPHEWLLIGFCLVAAMVLFLRNRL